MSFNFNPKIDRDFIISMYEDDYVYISEMFQTTLTQLVPDLDLLNQYFAANEVVALRQQVHKIKPAFGFVGLREVEQCCQQFENKCLSVSSTEELVAEYGNLVKSVDEGKRIIEQEIGKLKVYNSQA
jgi:HPt (histidine-containing phosphotransfer) domain-containing protein